MNTVIKTFGIIFVSLQYVCFEKNTTLFFETCRKVPPAKYRVYDSF